MRAWAVDPHVAESDNHSYWPSAISRQAPRAQGGRDAHASVHRSLAGSSVAFFNGIVHRMAIDFCQHPRYKNFSRARSGPALGMNLNFDAHHSFLATSLVSEWSLNEEPR